MLAFALSRFANERLLTNLVLQVSGAADVERWRLLRVLPVPAGAVLLRALIPAVPKSLVSVVVEGGGTRGSGETEEADRFFDKGYNGNFVIREGDRIVLLHKYLDLLLLMLHFVYRFLYGIYRYIYFLLTLWCIVDQCLEIKILPKEVFVNRVRFKTVCNIARDSCTTKERAGEVFKSFCRSIQRNFYTRKNFFYFYVESCHYYSYKLG